MSIVTVLTAIGLVAIVAASASRHREAQPQAERATQSEEPVFVCRLDALTSKERTEHKELLARLERGMTRVTEDAEGYTLHYA